MAQNVIQRQRNIVKHLGTLKAVDIYKLSLPFHSVFSHSLFSLKPRSIFFISH